MKHWWWLAGAVVLLIVAGGSNKNVRDTVMATIREPRGIRNNNPGNIRRTSTAWQGLAPVQQDEQFFQFSDPVYGIRAMARILMTYRDVHKLHSIRQIIERWAPPAGVDNNGQAYSQNTGAYVQHVAKALGISPDVPLTWNGQQLAELIEVMIRHENGTQPYSRELVLDGIKRAGWVV